MSDTRPDLSARYYIAEASIWVLGAILVVSQFVGLALGQRLPFLNVTLENSQYFPQVVAALLAAAVLYLIFEWKQSSRTARASRRAQARAAGTVLWACASFWLSYALIAQDTRFAGVSPAWYLGFASIGFFVGTFVATLAFSSLMIRTSEEARRLRLPRIPAATRAQFITWTPVVVLLIVAYHVLLHFSPEAIHGLAVLLVALPFLAMIGEELASLYFAHDEHGQPIPYAKRIAQFKEIHDSHDYSYLLIDQGDKTAQNLEIPMAAAPQAIQKAMQRRFSVDDTADPAHFHVQQEEETQIAFYPKDGDPHNESLENRGVRIQKHQGKRGLLRVLVIPENSKATPREMEISIALVEAHAEEYLSSHSDDTDLTFKTIFSYAINQTVIKAMVSQAEPLLHRAVERAQEKQVKELLEQNVDVNERAEAGWTALLYASAQGYPRIARLLLEAGANPDIGNVHNITPLMYSARYGNEEVCKLLIDYGAGLNLQDVYGETALMVAARTGHPKIAKLLITAGAEIGIRNRQAQSALDLAHLCKQGAIAKLLRRSANKPLAH